MLGSWGKGLETGHDRVGGPRLFRCHGRIASSNSAEDRAACGPCLTLIFRLYAIFGSNVVWIKSVRCIASPRGLDRVLNPRTLTAKKEHVSLPLVRQDVHRSYQFVAF